MTGPRSRWTGIPRYPEHRQRYLDETKKRFSGMKSHDYHVLMTQILPVALRRIMDEHVHETLFGLCNVFDVLSRKSISIKQLERLQGEIIMILCELEIYFPPRSTTSWCICSSTWWVMSSTSGRHSSTT
jgi:hypothetical protein